jgi:hypothetical protein
VPGEWPDPAGFEKEHRMIGYGVQRPGAVLERLVRAAYLKARAALLGNCAPTAAGSLTGCGQ